MRFNGLSTGTWWFDTSVGLATGADAGRCMARPARCDWTRRRAHSTDERHRNRESQYPCGFREEYQRSTAVSRFNATRLDGDDPWLLYDRNHCGLQTKTFPLPADTPFTVALTLGNAAETPVHHTVVKIAKCNDGVITSNVSTALDGDDPITPPASLTALPTLGEWSLLAPGLTAPTTRNAWVVGAALAAMEPRAVVGTWPY